MIRIYDKEEKIFSNLGLGSLDETLAALVVEELNGSYELEIQYPLKGRHFDKLQLKNIIFCKPNMYTREQPFRIYSITKPIDGKVTVNAEHISYDASGVTILPKKNTETKVIESFGTKVTHNDEEGYFLDTILTDIKAMSVLPTKNYFNLIRGSDKENVFKKDGYSIPAPTNLRSMLGGDSGSILEKFKGEYFFDRFDITLNNKRGVDRGLTIRYGKNMTDIEHESEGNNLFTAIFPFYSKNYTETQQTTKPIFQETYIIEGVTPLRADWLSIELIDVSKGIGGINLKPVVEVMKVIVDGVEDLVERYAPIRVKTPNDPENPSNDFYDKIYVFKRNTEEDGNLIKAYVSQKHIEQISVNDELKDIEIITELKLNPEDVIAITPVFGKIYVIQSEDSEHYNRKMIWDKGAFVEYSSDGFYVEAKDATLVDTLKDLKPIPTYPISWDEVNSKWIRDDQNGYIYVEPKKPNMGTVSVDKYVYVDLLEYELPEESNTLLENGVMYVNETLKNLSSQRILTLDLTGDLDSIDNLEPTDITSQHLFDKAEQYLKDNDLTKLKESITISFIKLSDSPEYEHLKSLEIVELGDEVNVIYEELGINSKHRVIATHYNVLTDSYDEIELGDKTAKITNNLVSSGDNVSSLKNDVEYTDKTYVVNFVAENANIINAEIQKAIIQTLEASNVNISGLLVASHATIDDLVSQMLVTDNAKISELLEAGSVRVRGKITALSGEIGGCKIEDGNLQVPTANITGLLNVDGKIDAALIEVDDITIGTGQVDGLLNVDGKIDAALIEVDDIVIGTGQVDGLLNVDGKIDAALIEVDDITIGTGQVDGLLNVDGKIEAALIEVDDIVIGTGQVDGLLNVDGKIDAALIEVDDIVIGTAQVDGLLNVDGKIEAALIEVDDIVIGTGQVDGLLNVDGKIDAALIEVDDITIGTGQVDGLLNVDGKIEAALIEVDDIVIGTGQVDGLLNVDGKIDAALIEVDDIVIGTAQVDGLLNVDGKIEAALIEVDDIVIGTGQVDGLLNVDGKIDAALIEVDDIVIGTGQVDGLLNVDGKIDAALIEVDDIVIGTAQVDGLLNVDGKIEAALIEVDDIVIGTGQVDGLLNVDGKIDAALIEVDDITVTNSIRIGSDPENPNFVVDDNGTFTIGDGNIVFQNNKTTITGELNLDVAARYFETQTNQYFHAYDVVADNSLGPEQKIKIVFEYYYVSQTGVNYRYINIYLNDNYDDVYRINLYVGMPGWDVTPVSGNTSFKTINKLIYNGWEFHLETLLPVPLGTLASTSFIIKEEKNINEILKHLLSASNNSIQNPYITDLDAKLEEKVSVTEKGVYDGVATLDGAGKIPYDQLPDQGFILTENNAPEPDNTPDGSIWLIIEEII